MASKRRASVRMGACEFYGIPIGDLERVRDLIVRCKGWTDEWDFIRDAVRRRLDEFGHGYPGSDAA